MSTKKVRCFTYKLKKTGNEVKAQLFKNVIESLFNGKDVNKLSNGNQVIIFDAGEGEKYLSLEYIKKLERNKDGITEKKEIDENFILFRIGKQRDLEDAIIRNNKTWEGKEIINKDEQESYNLEICTYILIDISNGVILELYGRYAPTVKGFTFILNNCFNKHSESKYNELSFQYNNIMTDELVEALADNGVRLGKIIYNYEHPKLEFLTQLGLTTEEINVIQDMGVFEVEVSLKGNGKVPLTRESDKIKKVVSTFGKSVKKVKDNISLVGTTKTTNSREYKFKEEEVTYNLDIPYERIEEGIKLKLGLDEICFEVYNKITAMYSENKEKIESYFN